MDRKVPFAQYKNEPGCGNISGLSILEKQYMQYRLIFNALVAVAVLSNVGHAYAANDGALAPQQAASKAKAGSEKLGAITGAKGSQSKALTPVKLVDINSATKAQLKKLPGIGDGEAAKIIAGRPYGSKTWLLSNNILAEDKYAAINGLIIAKQPSKDGAKNAALYKKK